MDYEYFLPSVLALSDPINQIIAVCMGAEFVKYFYFTIKFIGFAEDRDFRPFILDLPP